MNKEYGELSTIYYSLTKPVGHSIEGDIGYYGKKLEGVSGLVLEAGVGTGRMLIPLLQKGVDIEGVDSSAEMLKQCRINLIQHGLDAVLYEQDIMDLSLPKRYDAIIMPAGSFCILPRDMADEALGRLFNHLEVGGKLIVDLEMPSDFQAGKSVECKIAISNEKQILLTSQSEKIDHELQKVSYINKYQLAENGEVVKTELADFVLYWYEIDKFKRRLSKAGYKNISYQVGYGNKESDIITFIAYK